MNEDKTEAMKDAVEDTAETVTDAAEDAAETVEETVDDAAGKADETADDFRDALSNFSASLDRLGRAAEKKARTEWAEGKPEIERGQGRQANRHGKMNARATTFFQERPQGNNGQKPQQTAEKRACGHGIKSQANCPRQQHDPEKIAIALHRAVRQVEAQTVSAGQIGRVAVGNERIVGHEGHHLQRQQGKKRQRAGQQGDIGQRPAAQRHALR